MAAAPRGGGSDHAPRCRGRARPAAAPDVARRSSMTERAAAASVDAPSPSHRGQASARARVACTRARTSGRGSAMVAMVDSRGVRTPHRGRAPRRRPPAPSDPASRAPPAPPPRGNERRADPTPRSPRPARRRTGPLAAAPSRTGPRWRGARAERRRRLRSPPPTPAGAPLSLSPAAARSWARWPASVRLLAANRRAEACPSRSSWSKALTDTSWCLARATPPSWDTNPSSTKRPRWGSSAGRAEVLPGHSESAASATRAVGGREAASATSASASEDATSPWRRSWWSTSGLPAAAATARSRSGWSRSGRMERASDADSASSRGSEPDDRAPSRRDRGHGRGRPVVAGAEADEHGHHAGQLLQPRQRSGVRPLEIVDHERAVAEVAPGDLGDVHLRGIHAEGADAGEMGDAGERSKGPSAAHRPGKRVRGLVERRADTDPRLTEDADGAPDTGERERSRRPDPHEPPPPRHTLSGATASRTRALEWRDPGKPAHRDRRTVPETEPRTPREQDDERSPVRCTGGAGRPRPDSPSRWTRRRPDAGLDAVDVSRHGRCADRGRWGTASLTWNRLVDDIPDPLIEPPIEPAARAHTAGAAAGRPRPHPARPSEPPAPPEPVIYEQGTTVSQVPLTDDTVTVEEITASPAYQEWEAGVAGAAADGTGGLDIDPTATVTGTMVGDSGDDNFWFRQTRSSAAVRQRHADHQRLPGHRSRWTTGASQPGRSSSRD